MDDAQGTADRRSPSTALKQPDGTQQQLALDIFKSFGQLEMPLVEITQDFSLRKSSLLIDVSDLGLIARRAVNVCYFLAQANAYEETHVVDLRYYKWLIGYNSNNISHLRKALRDAQKAAVQVNSGEANTKHETWASVPMLGAVAIQTGKVIFKIPSELRPQIDDPERYSMLSMRMQVALSSAYALELYERLCESRDQRYTRWFELDEFRELIRVDGLKSASDFRYFKRDIIAPAIAQINAETDLDVALETKRTGRVITHIRFKVEQNAQRHTLLARISASKVLFDQLTAEFGLSEKELDEIAQNRDKWSEERLAQAVAAVKEKINDGVVIKYPAKYLMTAIREGWKVGSVELEQKRIVRETLKEKKAREEGVRRAHEQAMRGPDLDVELPSGAELDRAWASFVESPTSKVFGRLPPSFVDASVRQRKAFEGYLRSKHASPN
jgi:plasmid replication initiation protein